MEVENKIIKLSNRLMAVPAKLSHDNQEWLPLYLHGIYTGIVMEHIYDTCIPEHTKETLSKTIPREIQRDFLKFLGYVHDIGKITPAMMSKFITSEDCVINQRLKNADIYIDKMQFSETDPTGHALASEVILYNLGVPLSADVSVGAHHGMPQDKSNKEIKNHMQVHPSDYYGRNPDEDGKPKFQKELYIDLWNEYVQFSLLVNHFQSIEELSDPDYPEQFIIAGLVSEADWQASAMFDNIPIESTGEDIDIDQIIKIGLERINLPRYWEPNQPTISNEEFTQKFGFPPNPIQEKVLDIANHSENPGLFILEAPMGSGKTEVALSVTEIIATKLKCGGVAIGLPTQATTNGMFPRLKIWAESQSEEMQHAIRLAHGQAMMNREYQDLINKDNDGTGLVVPEWYANRHQVFMSEFVACCVDQMLKCDLKHRYVMMHALGLINKVVIIDEVHSYDAYMNEYLEGLLQWLGMLNVPVILLSATLPAEKRNNLIRAYQNQENASESVLCENKHTYPLLTWTDNGEIYQEALPNNTSSTTVHIEREDYANIPDVLDNMLQNGGCAGVILDTVKRAQDMAKMLEEQLPDKTILLIHSEFTVQDRAERETEILRRIGKESTPEDRNNLIVVGTQVLEQSLDIDFDILITDIAPMDLLLQRMGRLHRHTRKRPESLQNPTCIILNNDNTDGNSVIELIYSKWLIAITEKVLPNTIVLPDSIPDLIQDTYEEPSEEFLRINDLKDVYSLYQSMIADKIARAKMYMLESPRRTSATSISKNKLNISQLTSTPKKEQGDSDKEREAKLIATVRDAEPSVDVIFVVRIDENTYTFFSWVSDEKLDIHTMPTREETSRLLSQKARLPWAMSRPNTIEKTLEALETINKPFSSVWADNPLLADEYIVPLDENLSVCINGYQLKYDRESGLIHFKKKGGETE